MDSARLTRNPALRGEIGDIQRRPVGRFGGSSLTAGIALCVSLAAVACGTREAPLVLGATTSTYDSGLLEHLVSSFQTQHPEIGVRTVVMGSGEALALGRRGDVDVLLVHAPEAETRFVEEGYAATRTPVMYNDFLIVGPPGDPDRIATSDGPAQAFARIAGARAPFVSRGDNSGTHAREIAIWREAGVRPEGHWYLETGQGQGESLQIASERSAYTLTDRATYLALRDVIDLDPVVEDPRSLRNLYSVIVPAAGRQAQAAKLLADWLTSPAGREAIGEFRLRPGGAALFRPLLPGASPPLPGRRELEADPPLPPDSLRGSNS